MNSSYLPYRNSSIHYRYSGDGQHTVVCFHGFGTYAATFDWLAAHVPGHRFIAFDLPHHGLTRWNDGPTMTPEQLLEIIDSCPHVTSKKFALMGYSMGGRICLQLLQDVPHRITRIVLLAPDGLHFNPFYWMATQTNAGNRFFRKVMQDPSGFLKTLQRIEKLGLVNKGILKFVDRYMEDKHIRELTYIAWTMFRKFKPDKAIVARHLNEMNTPAILIYGKYDTIIPLPPGEKFFRQLTGRKRMEVIETGHQVLHVRNAAYLADAFNL